MSSSMHKPQILMYGSECAPRGHIDESTEIAYGGFHCEGEALWISILRSNAGNEDQFTRTRL
jgi:hypothetical protein